MTTATLKNRHRLRHRAPSLALAALTGCAALLSSSAAWAAPTPRDITKTSPVQLTCSGGTTAKAEFVTDTDNWVMKGRHGGSSWFAPLNITADSIQPKQWTKPAVLGGETATWLVPAVSADHADTSLPYLVGRLVELSGPIRLNTVNVHVDYFVDDYLNSVSVSASDPAAPTAVSSTHLSDSQSWMNAQTYDFNGGSWNNGSNYLVFEIQNNGSELYVGGNKGGAFGFAAKVTITAGCKAAPGSGTAAAVPVNNPWALGLLGVAVAGAAARTRRRRK